MKKYLFVGGLIAAGLNPTEEFLLTISHSGRGLYKTDSWEKIARDFVTVYPVDGQSFGIGPLDGQSIAITEVDYESGTLELSSNDGSVKIRYQEGSIEIT